MLQGGVADILARFLAEHPRVRIELDAPSAASTSSTKDSTSLCAYASHHWRIPIS
jgi:hypothetical protein